MEELGSVQVKLEVESISIDDVSSETVNPSVNLNSDCIQGGINTQSNVQNEIIDINDSNTKIEIKYNVSSCDKDTIEGKAEVKFDFNSTQDSLNKLLEPSDCADFELNSRKEYDLDSSIKSGVVENIDEYDLNSDDSRNESIELNNNQIEPVSNGRSAYEEDNYEREEQIQRLMLINTEEVLSEIQSEEDTDETKRIEEETGINVEDAPKQACKSENVSCRTEEDFSADWENKRPEQSSEELRQRLTFWDSVSHSAISRVCDAMKRKAEDAGPDFECKKTRS